jgi:hypothetical protein
MTTTATTAAYREAFIKSTDSYTSAVRKEELMSIKHLERDGKGNAAELRLAKQHLKNLDDLDALDKEVAEYSANEEARAKVRKDEAVARAAARAAMTDHDRAIEAKADAEVDIRLGGVWDNIKRMSYREMCTNQEEDVNTITPAPSGTYDKQLVDYVINLLVHATDAHESGNTNAGDKLIDHAACILGDMEDLGDGGYLL